MCGRLFETDKKLRRHFSRCHTFPCQKCDSVFESSILREEHMREEHKKKLRAGRKPRQRKILEVEVKEERVERDDDIERIYRCQKCPKRFKSIYSLNEHMFVHSNMHRFSCHVCSKHFTVQRHLTSHIRSAHKSHADGFVEVPNSSKPCGWCNETFQGCSLKPHLLTHIDEQVHSCGMCELTFKSIYGLRDHMLLKHSTVDNFLCPVCTRIFTDGKKVIRHVKTQHRDLDAKEHAEIIEKLEQQHGKDAPPKAKYQELQDDNAPKLRLDKDLKIVELVPNGDGAEDGVTEVPYNMDKLSAAKKRQIRRTLKEFKCDECDKAYAYSCDLRRHVRLTHRRERNYVCTVCKKGFSFPSELNGHMMMHSDGRNFQCDQCPRDYKQQRHLDHHKRKTHGWKKPQDVDENPENRCPVCNKTYSTSFVLRTHIKTHGERQFQCTVCDQRFLSASTLRGHMYKHDREKKFKCTFCGKGFTTRTYLKDHMSRHTNEKRYVCSMCGNSYHCAGGLGLHTRLKHSERKIYKCTLCSEGFMYKRQLDVHVYGHTGIKSHLCDTCGKPFIREESLRMHRRIHTGIKPHKCPECDMAFLKLYGLKRHMAVHAKKRPPGVPEPPLLNNLLPVAVNPRRPPMNVAPKTELFTENGQPNPVLSNEDRMNNEIPLQQNAPKEHLMTQSEVMDNQSAVMLRKKFDDVRNVFHPQEVAEKNATGYRTDYANISMKYLNQYDNRTPVAGPSDMRARPNNPVDNNEMPKFPTGLNDNSFYQDCMLYSAMFQQNHHQ